MIVDVSIDLFVEMQILGTGKVPYALLKEIRLAKGEIYQSLKPDPHDPEILRGSRIIAVKKRKFDVLFAADTRQIDRESDIYPMRVLNVEEVPGGTA